jgi:hypothetical protein
VAVVKGWADALRTGQAQRAAAYWAHPSVMVNGPDAGGNLTLVRIRSERDALSADQTLPCGATLRGATRNGRYVQADFTLGSRTGAGASSSGCSGPASVDFLIRRGHIARWLRAPTGSTPPQGGRPGNTSTGAQSV